IFLAVLGVASAGPFTGYAPEVQAERARFFQAFRAAQAAAAPQQALYHHAAPQQTFYAPVQPKWTGPVAATVPAGVDGTITPVSDTQEVSAARNAFLNAYNAQVRATVGAAPAVPSYTPTYHHAPAVPHQTFHHAAPVQPKWTGPVAATVTSLVSGIRSGWLTLQWRARSGRSSTYNRQAAAAAPPSRHYY
ncbi:cuticle protein CP1499-like, partial [Penaeus japonicus]|uniref:cuticle protein CP1499-like n=1 Tax=Penaeus japonicus TaxID=27405 RepID=UPI001C70C4D4